MDNIYTLGHICRIKCPILAFKKHQQLEGMQNLCSLVQHQINSMQYCNARLTDEYSYQEYTSPLTSLSRHHIIYGGHIENYDTLIIFLNYPVLKSLRLLYIDLSPLKYLRHSILQDDAASLWPNYETPGVPSEQHS